MPTNHRRVIQRQCRKEYLVAVNAVLLVCEDWMKFQAAGGKHGESESLTVNHLRCLPAVNTFDHTRHRKNQFILEGAAGDLHANG